MSPRWGYLILVVLPIIGFGAMAYSAIAHRPHNRGACYVAVTSPVTVACTDGHSYVRQGGAWVDLGPVSHGAMVPRR